MLGRKGLYMNVKVIEIRRVNNVIELIEEINIEVKDEVWNDVEELWYEYNKRYDSDIIKEGCVKGWDVYREGNVIVVEEEWMKLNESVMFVKI